MLSNQISQQVDPVLKARQMLSDAAACISRKHATLRNGQAKLRFLLGGCRWAPGNPDWARLSRRPNLLYFTAIPASMTLSIGRCPCRLCRLKSPQGRADEDHVPVDLVLGVGTPDSEFADVAV